VTTPTPGKTIKIGRSITLSENEFYNGQRNKGFFGLLVILILFHLSIIAKIIPYNITWGGRLTNDTEMYVFETISISNECAFSLGAANEG
jgi:hypothetical protein